MPVSNAAKKTSATNKTAGKATKAKTSGAASADAKKPVAANKKSPKPASPASKKKAAPLEKAKKTRIVRDSFTMPENEYQVLRDMKKACLKAGVEVKKSELLRIGVALIKSMDPAAVKAAAARLAPLKAGRPKKSES